MKKYVVSGTDYDIRYKVGNIFKEYLCRKIKKYNEKILDKNVYSKVKELEAKLKNESFNCLEEIYVTNIKDRYARTKLLQQKKMIYLRNRYLLSLEI